MSEKNKFMLEVWLRKTNGAIRVSTQTLSILLGPGFSKSTLDQMRSDGLGPPSSKGVGLRAAVTYNLWDVIEWLETQKIQTA